MPAVHRRLRLAPSLLSADFGAIGDAARAAVAGGADALHLDVMDGHFVPNISFGPALVKAVRERVEVPLDVHLMIERPERYLEAFAKAGGNTLVFHLESRDDPGSVVRAAHALGAQVGAAIRPDTAFERLEPWTDKVDQLLVMSVNPGFSGQRFIPEVLPKVHRARAALDAIGSAADVSIDGGVTAETARGAAREGATFFVCGNSVFAGGDIAENLRALRRAVEEGASGAVR